MRSTLGVIVGYVVMFILQVAMFMIIYSLMGPDWSFRPASFQPSTQWTLVQFIVIFVAAAIAGLVCALIAGRGKSALILAGVVMAMGLLLGAMSNSMTPADTRTAAAREISAIEAISTARHPIWVVLVNPFIAVVGIIVGGSLKRAR